MVPQKIIVTGCARSGTTLLHSLLSCFKQIKIYKYKETHPSKLNTKNSDGVKKKYILIKRPQFPDSDPRCFSFQELFDQGYLIINIIRDARDVFVSRHPDDPAKYWVEPERWIDAVNQTILHRNNPKLFLLTYEHLVIKTNQVLNEIAAFLKVAWDRDLLPFYNNKDIKTYLGAATIQGAKPVFSDSVGNWKNEIHKERINNVFKTHGKQIDQLLEKLRYC